MRDVAAFSQGSQGLDISITAVNAAFVSIRLAHSFVAGSCTATKRDWSIHPPIEKDCASIKKDDTFWQPLDNFNKMTTHYQTFHNIDKFKQIANALSPIILAAIALVCQRTHAKRNGFSPDKHWLANGHLLALSWTMFWAQRIASSTQDFGLQGERAKAARGLSMVSVFCCFEYGKLHLWYWPICSNPPALFLWT